MALTVLPLLLSLARPAEAGPWLVGVGARQVFREEAALDGLSLSVAPTWGPLAVEVLVGWGMGDAAPGELERTLAEISLGRDIPGEDIGMGVDRATLGLAAVLAPPVPLRGAGLRGGPRAILGFEARLLEQSRLVMGEEGAPVAGLEGWSLVEDGLALGFGPVLGLGFSLTPIPRTALRLDLRDRVLVRAGEAGATLDAPGDTLLRHDFTLSLDVALALGGGR